MNKKDKNKDVILVDEQLNVPELKSILECDSCGVRDKCTHYKEKSKCTLLNNLPINNTRDLAGALMAVAKKEIQRYMRGAIFEEANGGELEKTVSGHAENIFKLAKIIKELSRSEQSLVITSKGNSPAKNILETLLGGKDNGK